MRRAEVRALCSSVSFQGRPNDSDLSLGGNRQTAFHCGHVTDKLSQDWLVGPVLIRDIQFIQSLALVK